MKFNLNVQVVPSGSRTFGVAPNAEAEPLAAALFAVSGVKSLFFLNNFITVTKDPEVQWASIVEDLKAALSTHLNP